MYLSNLSINLISLVKLGGCFPFGSKAFQFIYNVYRCINANHTVKHFTSIRSDQVECEFYFIFSLSLSLSLFILWFLISPKCPKVYVQNWFSLLTISTLFHQLALWGASVCSIVNQMSCWVETNRAKPNRTLSLSHSVYTCWYGWYKCI